MESYLSAQDACFVFRVQRRSRPATMPIEDPTIEWSEQESAYVPLAKITIPRQSFSSLAQMNFCENLSFTPWHSLPEHRPLGGINRVRKIVYREVSKTRHEANGAPRLEPSGF